MDILNTKKIKEFLDYFKSRPEAGLLVFASGADLEETKLLLTKQGFILADDWAQIMTSLKGKQSVALMLGEKLSPEIYSLIAQYSDRAGEIQLVNPATIDLEQIEFNPRDCHLLILTTESDWQRLDEEYNLKNKIGLIERIK
ncbi:MAG: hypothetical protein WCW56_02420 [Candidatus Paceibacterota bacterium]|jgi:hypothetical protein